VIVKLIVSQRVATAASLTPIFGQTSTPFRYMTLIGRVPNLTAVALSSSGMTHTPMQ
jgi:hypothetical protein